MIGRFLLVVAIVLGVSGCAQVQKAFDIYSVATTTIANPVTPERLHAFEASLELVFLGLNTYRRNCLAGNIPQSCHQVIAKLRTYTRRVPGYLDRLRRFVRNNDQVNAAIVYQEISSLVSEIRQEAYINNVELVR